MKEAIIIHTDLCTIGGAEQVFLAAVNVLNKLGYKINVVTCSYPCNSIINLSRRLHNIRFKYVLCTEILPRTLAASFLELSTLKSYKRNYLIINTSPLSSPFMVGNLLYVHFPYYFTELINSSITTNRAFGYFFYPFIKLIRRLEYQLGSRKIMVFNSHFTKKITMYFLRKVGLIALSNVKLYVLYPPVRSRYIFDKVKELNYDRENIVVTISRISPDKHLWNILQVAKMTSPNIKFIIIGRIHSKEYYRFLKGEIEASSLSRRIILATEVSEDKKIELLAKAKVYFHPKPAEHFGISIVEAMAAGVIPIVHKIGGAREFLPNDILYENLSEAARLIEKWILKYHKSGKLISMLMSKALEFNQEKFEEKLMKIIIKEFQVKA